MMSNDFKMYEGDKCVYAKSTPNGYVKTISIHVGDCWNLYK